MITRIEITGKQLELGDDIQKYAKRKVSKLDKYLPRAARKSVHAAIKIAETNNSSGDKYECEILLYVPEQSIVAKDATMNMFAAVDIVEAKIKHQLQRYKQQHIAAKRAKKRGLLRRFKRTIPGETA